MLLLHKSSILQKLEHLLIKLDQKDFATVKVMMLQNVPEVRSLRTLYF